MENELLRLSAQHLAIQEAERKRIAADLHDGLGQALSLVHLSIEHASSLLQAGSPEQAAECLDRLKPRVREAVEDVRRIAMNLRPATLDSLGILATLSWYFRDFNANCPGISLEFECGIDESDIPHVVKLPMFRIVQEATSNAVKHASGNRIKVGLVRDSGAIELSVADDGRGFDTDEVAGRKEWFRSLGLQSMRERAQLSGGAYRLDSAAGEGTRILVRWPLSLGQLQAAPEPGMRAVRDLDSDESTGSRDLTGACGLADRVARGKRIDQVT